MVKTRNSIGADDSINKEFMSSQPRRTRGNERIGRHINGYQSDESGIVTFYENKQRRSRRTVALDSSPEDMVLRRSSRHHSQSADRNEPGSSRQDGTSDYGIRRSTRQKRLMYGSFNQNLIDKDLQLIAGEEEPDRRGRRRVAEVEKLSPGQQDADEDVLDMYSRVKRVRRQVKRDMYGVPIADTGEDEDKSQSSSSSSEDSDDESDSEEEEDDKPSGRSYFLREHKPRTKLYEAPIETRRPKVRSFFRETPPPSSRRKYKDVYRSPAHKSPSFHKRRLPELPDNSSTSSSSNESSDDERRFQHRKAKSMARARKKCMPMNFTKDDVSTGLLRDRAKVGSSLADVEPMNIDKSVNFDHVGGLGKHIRSLKEMIVFPLLYPEVFEKFHITPPRGVLFYGPPGTGKTLVARALTNECSVGDRKIAFFMRKGADCLSKWVGESERQLRLLFDQAYQMRPSIIFFDEIDGIAPVRSSRQDQIHSSIVSTLLALMDGLDNRGEIVVIGATNRIDSIDPALRRPGRFDRELLFPLPSVEARKQILEIHTREWRPKLLHPFLAELAENCVGYCGADLKSVCTEAALHALRRRYPQIYTSSDKLELDLSAIQVTAKDFHEAMQTIVPASQRSVMSPRRQLSSAISQLLQRMFHDVILALHFIFPNVLAQLANLEDPEINPPGSVDDGDDRTPSIAEPQGRRSLSFLKDLPQGPFMDFSGSSFQRPFTHRPRLLLAGKEGQGQSSHIGPAVLHHLERLPAHVLDLPALYAVSAKTPEESCAQVFREARRTAPSVIYMPHIENWWEVVGDTVRATFLTLLQDLEPTTPVLLLATSNVPHAGLSPQVKLLFDVYSKEVVHMLNPNDEERRKYFEPLLLQQATKPPPRKQQTAGRVLEVLPKAKPPEPRQLTGSELKRLHSQEENTLRELRIFLRDILNKLGRDRKFAIFAKPVDMEEVQDYYDIVKNPMDLSTMMTKIDLHKYQTVREFMTDIDLIASNALEYNPDKDPGDRAIRHRACALRDTSNALIASELDPDFEKLCEEAAEARKRRGEDSASTVPDFYLTKPLVRARQAPAEQKISFQMPSPKPSPQKQPRVIKVPIRSFRSTKDNYKKNKNKSPWCKPSRRRKRYKLMVIEDSEDEAEGVDQNNDVVNEERNLEEVQEKDEEVRNQSADEGKMKRTPQMNSVYKDSVASTSQLSPCAKLSLRHRSPIPETVTCRSRQNSPTSSKRYAAEPPCLTSTSSNDSTSRSDSGVTSGHSNSGGENGNAGNREEIVTTPTSARKRKHGLSESEADSGTEQMPDKTDSSRKDRRASVDIHSDTDNTTNRQTRSQTTEAPDRRSRMMSEDPIPECVVDVPRLHNLLDRTVSATNGCHVDKLERLYTSYGQCIFSHRNEYVKHELVQELEHILNRFVQS